MRACAAGLLTAALCLPPGAALAEPGIRASFFQPAEPAQYDGDWPVWARMKVEITRSAGSDTGIFKGQMALTWQLVPDEGGFFLGHAPVVADVDRDGPPELVVIQYLPSTGWRMAVIRPPLPEFGIHSSANFAAGADQAVLLGVIGAQGDAEALIGVVVSEKGENRLLIYEQHDKKPVTLGPYPGYGAGPAGPGPRILSRGDRRAFLVASDKDGTVTAFGRDGGDERLRVWASAIPATVAGFVEAASCD